MLNFEKKKLSKQSSSFLDKNVNTQSSKHLAHLRNIMGRNDTYETELTLDLNKSIESISALKESETPYFSLDFSNTS
mgnify:CR=1 FL=1